MQCAILDLNLRQKEDVSRKKNSLELSYQEYTNIDFFITSNGRGDTRR